MTFRLLLAICFCAANAFSQSETQKLAAIFSGRWAIMDKSEPSVQHPNGFTTKGEEHWYTLAGGIPLIEEYHSKAPDGADVYDTAVFWWDATAHKYAGLFCAKFLDQGCVPFDIAWRTDPRDEIVMSGEYLQGGKKQTWREVFIFPARTTFTQTLFLGEAGHELKLAAVISATRISDTR